MVTALALASIAGIVGAGGPAAAATTVTAAKPLFEVYGKTYLGEVCKTQTVDKLKGVSATGPFTLRMNLTGSVSATWSAKTGVGAGAISAEMGFDVTKSYSISIVGSYAVPSGKRGHLEAYPCFARYSFKTRLITGGASSKGFAEKPVGVHFKKWLTKK
ncbi:hypothetical protein [Nonomuraea sp. NPDC049784]|uniref:hypothetical protein n=1 Tax=Nonomuraea sp. NPDC049784 TaxID=3154361 RepID=UPI0033C233EE